MPRLPSTITSHGTMDMVDIMVEMDILDMDMVDMNMIFVVGSGIKGTPRGPRGPKNGFFHHRQEMKYHGNQGLFHSYTSTNFTFFCSKAQEF